MKRHTAILLLVASTAYVSTAVGAVAAPLPAVKSGAGNTVPQCATPGRLLAFLKSRNGQLAERFAQVPVAYMRHGEQLGVRWDLAFFQMLLETGNLTFKRGDGKPGLVRADQNNFAGLGATGRGERGEAFSDIDSGVKAHLQHLLMYTGQKIDDPVANRTAKVQSWGILTSWQKRFKRPITFGDIAAKWAPGSRGYGRDIQDISERFYDGFCTRADPRPDLVARTRGTVGRQTTVAAAAGVPIDTGLPMGGEKVSGEELAKAALKRGQEEGTSLQTLGVNAGATPPGPDKTGNEAASKTVSITGLKILNETTPLDAGRGPGTVGAGVKDVVTTASAAAASKPAVPAAGSDNRSDSNTAAAAAEAAVKCRVWTASYGGAKSVIIRSANSSQTNFTVLDVNDGQETRETDAYISAYAKGGKKIAEFPSQTAALSKAFELCPEG